MSHLPSVSFRIMDKLLRRLGFQAVRQKGSHIFYRHPDGRTTSLIDHAGRDYGRPLLRDILREIELPPEEFQRSLHDL
ncbi:MAG: type II toxin-antitoxin system HicA family toxin [Planctomycetota bacterium]